MPELVAGTDIIITEALGIDSIYISVDSGKFLTTSDSLLDGDFLPSSDLAYDLGTETTRWNSVNSVRIWKGLFSTDAYSVGIGENTLSSTQPYVDYPIDPNLYLTALGVNALKLNTLGFNNTAVGTSSLENNTSGNYNTAVGTYSLWSNTTGSRNTAFGNNALNRNETGFRNTAIGNFSLFDNTTGYRNTTVGDLSLSSNTTGHSNTSVGASSLESNTTGIVNTALGKFSLLSNTAGSGNVAVGSESLEQNTIGEDNTAVGSYALSDNTTGSNNTAVGAQALINNLADGNTAVGRFSMLTNISGQYNTAAGYDSFFSNNGSNNVSIGAESLRNGYDLNEVTALGYRAGYSMSTGTNLLILGANASASSNNVSNEITLGDTNITSFRVPGIDLTVDTSDLVYGGNLLPSTTLTYNLGSSDSRWNDLYLSSNSIYFGSEVVTASDSKLYINGTPASDPNAFSVTNKPRLAEFTSYSVDFLNPTSATGFSTYTGVIRTVFKVLNSISFDQVTIGYSSSGLSMSQMVDRISSMSLYVSNSSGSQVSLIETIAVGSMDQETTAESINYLISNLSSTINASVGDYYRIDYLITDGVLASTTSSAPPYAVSDGNTEVTAVRTLSGGGTTYFRYPTGVRLSGSVPKGVVGPLDSNDLSNYTDATVGYAAVKSTDDQIAWVDPSSFGTSLSYLSDGSGETISSGSIVPSTTLTYDLGSSDSRWNDLYLSGSSLYLGDSVLSSSDGILLSNQSFEVDGNITATGSITSLSDASRKTDIENIINPLSIVNQLSGVYFKFIDDEEGRRQVGLIAQDTEPVLPEVVFDHTDGFKSVSYGNLVAVLIEAIKELSDEVDKLKQGVE